MLKKYSFSASKYAAYNTEDAAVSARPTKREINRALKRIERMEKCFDKLVHGAAKKPPVISKRRLAKLTDYYENGQWLRDWELDDMGYFPQTLKRGVLSEDGGYNLLAELGSKDED